MTANPDITQFLGYFRIVHNWVDQPLASLEWRIRMYRQEGVQEYARC
jgi:hypothetical protein